MKKIVLFLSFCFSLFSANARDFVLVDKKATKETANLYANLQKVQKEKKIIFGQQDATMYGREWEGDANRSDAKDVCGDHPALLGLDFEYVNVADSLDFEKAKKRLLDAVKETHARGGIVTFCWHMKNPITGGSFYWEQDSTIVVKHIIPGGKYHEEYKRILRTVASVAKEFKDKDGKVIPIIFRPFHEFDGEWFWWGKGHCTKDEFVSLWQFTVEYLRDEQQVHNFLYAFSPDCRFNTEIEFLDYYPGDEYVDILGMDNYWDFRPDGANNPQLAETKLKIVSELAKQKNKVAALTETGLEGIPNPVWYTEVLLPILRNVGIAYVQAWRNAYQSETHYYVPTKGHIAEPDFIKFYQQDDILFESQLPDMYKSIK